MNFFSRYFSGQFKLLFLLLVSSAIPLTLIYLFSPYEVPHIQYFFMVVLLVLRIIFFREDEYRKSLQQVARGQLQRIMKRKPSENDILGYIDARINGRDMMFFIAVASILFVTIYFGKF